MSTDTSIASIENYASTLGASSEKDQEIKEGKGV
jgi:hypothetical protein